MRSGKPGRVGRRTKRTVVLSKSDRRWMRFMRWGARLGCHQMPERSLFFRGRQFPLCARCTGVWIGYGLGAICLIFWQPPFWLSCVLAGCMLLDWTVQRVGLRESTNVRRVITGTLGGFGVLTGTWTALWAIADRIMTALGV